MKQRHHSPEQVIRKLAEGDKLLTTLVCKTVSMVNQLRGPSASIFPAQPQHNNCREWSGIVGDFPTH